MSERKSPLEVGTSSRNAHRVRSESRTQSRRHYYVFELESLKISLWNRLAPEQILAVFRLMAICSDKIGDVKRFGGRVRVKHLAASTS